MKHPIERRLAAILAADVAGYSRLMGADEEGTHERLKVHLGELVQPKIGEHRGRIVKNTGDGLLAEFASVLDAVRCAVEIQRGIIDREPELPEERRIRFRIGINLGDVIVEEHDIFGDGVNVAARLEALAEPGGICVSRVVRDQVRDKLDIGFEDMGEQSVKNIARPVRAYVFYPEGVASTPTASVSSGTSSSPPVAAPRLSIVVLPFVNLSDDREQQYFADGITEDVTTDLSRIADMLVISRNTAFTYRSKPVDTKQIGRELGVRYLLEGSVRRSGCQVRVNAQLIDAERDALLWADRFDGDTADLFALQDEITSRIAVALNLELIGAEAVRPTEHPDAVDYILRGRAVVSNPRSRGKYAEAISLFERALELDPRSVPAQSWLAFTLANRVINQMTDTTASDVARAEGLRNSASALLALGHSKLMTGSIEEVIPLIERAIRLSPRDPQIAVMHYRIGEVHLLQSRTDKAIPCLEKARSGNPELQYVHAFLASAYALNGKIERAAAELTEARRFGGNDRYSSIAQVRAAGYYEVPKVVALFETTYFEGLRKAGVPEE